jgi:hypothetical protein
MRPAAQWGMNSTQLLKLLQPGLIDTAAQSTICIVGAMAIVGQHLASIEGVFTEFLWSVKLCGFKFQGGKWAMKHTIRFAVVALCLSFMAIATAVAQDQYTEGGVTRVTLVQILPGHFNAFMDDLKTNIKPIWDAEKKAGLIEGYNIFLNTTKSNPDDWDIGFGLSYKNFAALDGLAQKVLDLRMKQYGDKGKEQQVIDKRAQNGRVVTSVLTREITLK